MKAYRFRLESVLRVRRLQERVATQQLAEAVRALHHAQSEAACARRSLEDAAAPVGLLTIGAFEWSHEQATRLSDTAPRQGRSGRSGGRAGAAGRCDLGDRTAAHGDTREARRAPSGALAAGARPQ